MKIVASASSDPPQLDQRGRLSSLGQVTGYLEHARRIPGAEQAFIDHRAGDGAAATQRGIATNDQGAVDITHRGVKPGDVVIAVAEQVEIVSAGDIVRGFVKINQRASGVAIHGPLAV